MKGKLKLNQSLKDKVEEKHVAGAVTVCPEMVSRN